MIIELDHIKGLELFGAVMGFLQNRERRGSCSEEPHFEDDPVPGDSFPHHIFNRE